MKYMKKIVALAMLVLMLFALCACGQDTGGDVLKGTWTRTSEYEGEVVITFNGKGGCEASWAVDGSPMKDKGKYTIESDSTATVKLNNWSDSQGFTFEVSDTTLKISDNYSIFGGEFTKK